ncbi:MAG: hypothetical protein J3K34DRAFT_463015 [Monoraphidium minutum]|nr:MAG: hypothetical protein J3K34DRAFT_463015 [Monoraphidium minutum]
MACATPSAVAPAASLPAFAGLAPVTTKRVHKGKTLAEIEEEEGGPVKESLVGMAHRAGETELPDDIARRRSVRGRQRRGGGDERRRGGRGRRRRGAAGAAAGGGAAGVRVGRPPKRGDKGKAPPLPGDDGPMTGFNLDEERAGGHFDEEGNFVFDRGDAGDRDDEWLRSDEGKVVVSAELRKRVEAEHAAMQEAEAAPVLSEAQVARAQLEMSRIMAPGESVAAALKRMRGGDAAGAKKAMGKREKARLAKLEAERAAKGRCQGRRRRRRRRRGRGGARRRRRRRRGRVSSASRS